MTAHDDRPQQTPQPAFPDEPASPDTVVARVPGAVTRAGTRSDRVVAWIGWHLGELVGVGLPAVLAVTVHPLWTVPAGLVAAGWIANEIRVARLRGYAGLRGLWDRSRHPRAPGTDGEVRDGLA